MQKAIGKEKLIEDLKRVAEKIDHVPSLSEYKIHGKFSLKPFSTCFGSWSQAIFQTFNEPVGKGGQPSFKHIFGEPEVYDKFLQIKCDKAMIWFDPHVDFHDTDFHNEAMEVARRLGIKTVVLGGDGLDFKSLYRKETQSSPSDWIQDLKAYENYIETLCNNFDVVYDIMGNHNWRLARLLGKSEQMTELYELIFKNPKYKPSQYFYALLNDWLYIVHPDRMRKSKLSLAEELVDHHRKSVITAHSHRFAFGVHDSGIEIIGDGLCMTKPEYHEYHGLKLDTYSAWIQGFWILLDDKIVPYVKHDRIANLI
jgi:hypothetical protein